MRALDSCPRCGSNRKNVGATLKCDITIGFHPWHRTPPEGQSPTRTHVDSPYNSTRFTNCCNVAVVKRNGAFEPCSVCLREVVT